MISNKHKQLESIDWDFFLKSADVTNKIHWYPGTFPQEIPSVIIQAFSEKNDIIFDPYGGIGTTLSEALRLGRKCIISEINPVGLLSSYVAAFFIIMKSIEPLILENVIKNIEYFIGSIGNYTELLLYDDYEINEDIDYISSIYINPVPNTFLSQICIDNPNWLLLNRWIEDSTLQKIKDIYYFSIRQKHTLSKLIILCMLSNILYYCSSQNRSWGHLADNVMPKEFIKKDVKSTCLRWLNRIKHLIQKIPYNLLQKDTINAWIVNHNWLSNIENNMPINASTLLITSPPYAGAIDYIRSQRLSLYLFGFKEFDINNIASVEIGCRRQRNKSNFLNNWVVDLESCLEKQLKVLCNDYTVALILPSSSRNREIANIKMFEFLNNNGCHEIFRTERSISSLNTSQSWTSIKKEEILIFKKEISK